jgi:hypothetical protein
MFQPNTIVDLGVKVGAAHLILGAPRRNMLVKLVRGNNDPSGFQVFTGENPFIGLRVIGQTESDVHLYTLSHNPSAGGEGYEVPGSCARMRRSEHA